MKILVFNAGSSSLKFGVFDLALADHRVFKGEFAGFNAQGCTLHYRVGGETGSEQQRPSSANSLDAAFHEVRGLLEEFACTGFVAIGHRVVHGGEFFQATTLIDERVLGQLDQSTPLAPLHNPASLAGIRLSLVLWPDLPQAAVFDTAFHQTMPAHATTYAVPGTWRALGLRRYGFHGTSHHYVALRTAAALQTPLDELRIVSCHLGNGASACAISHGISVDTSMGMTPMEGLVMGTRAGDVDPGIFAFLARELKLDAAAIEEQLNNASGLKALCGSADMRDIETRAGAGDAAALLAQRIYAYRVRKYIGAYAAAMGGVDAVVFTGGIGENSADMRRRICERLEFLGLALDEERNLAPLLDNFAAPQIQAVDSRVHVLVTRTNEQYMIAREVQALLQASEAGARKPVTIPVAVSARHVHLSQAAVEQLFGKGHQLTLERVLTQPDGWAAAETVELIGPGGSFPHVRVMGPPRSATQIEISRTDALALGIDVPLRDSGDLHGSPVVRLRGSAGEISTDGLIVSARHVHISPADAARLGLKDRDYVEMKVGQGERAATFGHTLVRVKDSYVTEMHIDTDEANAAGVSYCSSGELIGVAGPTTEPARTPPAAAAAGVMKAKE